MKYYTTITIDNTVVGNIKNHPVEFVNKIIDACSGVYYRIGKDAFGLGIDESFVKIQKPREFTETTVFVFRNGTLYEVAEHSSITNELKEHDPEKYNELIRILEENLTSLTNEKLEVKAQWAENYNVDEERDIIFTLDTSKKDVINSGEAHIVMKDDEALVAQWLKDNKIPTTVAKLKKLKPAIKAKTK